MLVSDGVGGVRTVGGGQAVIVRITTNCNEPGKPEVRFTAGQLVSIPLDRVRPLVRMNQAVLVDVIKDGEEVVPIADLEPKAKEPESKPRRRGRS